MKRILPYILVLAAIGRAQTDTSIVHPQRSWVYKWEWSTSEPGWHEWQTGKISFTIDSLLKAGDTTKIFITESDFEMVDRQKDLNRQTDSSFNLKPKKTRLLAGLYRGKFLPADAEWATPMFLSGAGFEDSVAHVGYLGESLRMDRKRGGLMYCPFDNFDYLETVGMIKFRSGGACPSITQRSTTWDLISYNGAKFDSSKVFALGPLEVERSATGKNMARAPKAFPNFFSRDASLFDARGKSLGLNRAEQ
jgi:hypothetical protein